MRGRGIRVWIVVFSFSVALPSCQKKAAVQRKVSSAVSQAPGRLRAIGPRIVSNDADYPVVLYGNGLRRGSTLALSTTPQQRIETYFVDDRHLTAVIPAGVRISAGRSAQRVQVAVIAPDGVAATGRVTLTVVNNRNYPLPVDLELAPGGDRLFVASTTTDEVWVLERDNSGAPRRIKVGDGPNGLARYRDSAGQSWLLVSHQHDAELRLIRMARPEAAQLRIPVVRNAQGVVVSGNKAYVTNHLTDSVHVVDLRQRKVVGEHKVGVNPRPMAVSGPEANTLWVGNLDSDDVSVIDLKTSDERRLYPAKGMSIIGGHTEKYAKYIMGGKAPRAFAVSRSLGKVFVASIGPNIGPNPDKMEVSMNGGISVIDAASAEFVRHVSMIEGVPQSLALDDQRGLLYVADIARGHVIVLDAKYMAKSDRLARKRVVFSREVDPPPDMVLVRNKADFDVKRRAGIALHSGPWALRLTADGGRLFVLSRFTGIVNEYDTSQVRRGKMPLVRSWPGPPLKYQRGRRLGETIYYTDLGNSRMTCDTCHPGGHNGGVLFTKGKPMRIYRSTSLRGSAESAPYFTPARLKSLGVVSRFVLGRNRFHNPDPDRREAKFLTAYTMTLAPLPNPYVGRQGRLPNKLQLPDGKTGSAVAGLEIFEGRGGCANGQCHPAPHFTADQDSKTRGQLRDVGTPTALPLRKTWQEAADTGVPPPSLTGVWDNFPLLHTGAGGLTVDQEGGVRPTHPFALRHVLELSRGGKHGNVAGLSAQEQNDLLAYLLTL